MIKSIENDTACELGAFCDALASHGHRTLLCTGGQQRPLAEFRSEWHAYRKGIVGHLDISEARFHACVEYVTPESARAARGSVLFKSGTLQDGKLHACTTTEIMSYCLRDFTLHNYISIPCFNDVHHVSVLPNGNYLVAVTGLDLVVEVAQDGSIAREWSVNGESTWGRFSRTVDYRRIATTKPHKSHPNFVLTIDDDIWVTRFEQKDAICLTDPTRCIRIGIERPHDGIVMGHRVYFTTVDGHVVIANHRKNSVERIVAIRDPNNSDVPLGWCRGLFLLNSDLAIVGFSRIRRTRFHSNIQWATSKFTSAGQKNVQPTRLALCDLASGYVLSELTLEPFGINTLFSIHVM